MLRTAVTLAALGAVAAAIMAGSPASQTTGGKPFPQVIQLPTGFRPEGIEVGRGTTFYTGSVANGAIFRGDLRTGNGAILVPGLTGEAATGIELDRHKHLFVAAPEPGRPTSTAPGQERCSARTSSGRRRTRSSTTWS
jgi:hypothetical protein